MIEEPKTKLMFLYAKTIKLLLLSVKQQNPRYHLNMSKNGYLKLYQHLEMATKHLPSKENSIMRDMMSVLLEGALDEELDEELGYSKYDYRNKETDNSRNGHSSKTMHTSYGDMDGWQSQGIVTVTMNHS